MFCFLTKLQVKSGDIRDLANISLTLVKKECSSEIRLHAFKMLQVLLSSLEYPYIIQYP